MAVAFSLLASLLVALTLLPMMAARFTLPGEVSTEPLVEKRPKPKGVWGWIRRVFFWIFIGPLMCVAFLGVFAFLGRERLSAALIVGTVFGVFYGD